MAWFSQRFMAGCLVSQADPSAGVRRVIRNEKYRNFRRCLSGSVAYSVSHPRGPARDPTSPAAACRWGTVDYDRFNDSREYNCNAFEGDGIKRFIITAVMIAAVAVLVWLYSRDVGLVGGVIFVAGIFIAGHYAYQWGNRKSLENEKNLQELIDKKKNRKPPMDSES